MELDEIKKLYDGVIKIKNGRIVYPTKEKIMEMMSEIEERMAKLRDEIKILDKSMPKKRKISIYLDPLFIQHWLKYKMDRNYRDAVEKVGLPVDRIKESRWRKVIELFMKDLDYRERLVEALTSELGKHRKGLKKEAEELERKKVQLVEKRRKRCLQELEKLEKRANILRKMLEFC